MKANKKNISLVERIIGDRGFAYKSACNRIKFRIYNSYTGYPCHIIEEMFPQLKVEGDFTTLYDYNRESDTFIVVDLIS